MEQASKALEESNRAEVVAKESVARLTGELEIHRRLAEAEDLDLLAKGTVMPIQALDGITRTLTCPVLQL